MQKPMPKHIEEIAEKHLSGQPSGGIITVKEEPALRELVPTCFNYVSKTWWASRRQVDQLDQVTFMRRKQT